MGPIRAQFWLPSTPLASWTRRNWRKTDRTSGIPIENCTLSIIGGIQPARIAPLVRGAATGISDDGLIQRLQLTVWPDDIGSWKWTDRHPDAVARERYDAAFRTMHDFARKFETPAVFGFSSAAQDMFKQ
jgi:hypothetical protein